MRLSQGPVWKTGAPGGLHARAIGLRVFACATPTGYVVMPGGLTRVATGSDARIITMQRGGSSKDTWVQASTKTESHNLLKRTTTSKDLVRDDTHLSSRMAENLFWFGRSAERCDNTARLLRLALNFLSNVVPANRGDEWPTIMALCSWFHLIELDDKKQSQEQSQTQSDDQNQSQTQSQSQSQDPEKILSDEQIEAALLSAVTSPDVPGLASQQQQLHRVAGQLSERFSVDNWRALNQMAQKSAAPEQALSKSETMSVLDDATAALMTMTGFALDGMTRDLGWRFLSMGRRLERLQFQSVALQRALSMGANGSLEWLLELSDSIITYRARYRAQPEWLPVLDLLLLDESNPRSILFQLAGILKSLKKIAHTYGPCNEQQLALLTAELQALEPDTDLYGNNTQLIDLLSRIQDASEILSEQISLQFFSHTGNHQQRSSTL